MKKFVFQLIAFCLLSFMSYAQSTSYTLTAASGGTGYQWFKDGVAISGATSSTYLANTAGSYYATFNNGTCNTQTPTTVLATSGSSVTFNASSTTGTYQWKSGSSGSSTPISGATSSSYTTSTAGVYSVAVTTSSCTAPSNDYYLYYLAATSGNCLAGSTAPSVN